MLPSVIPSLVRMATGSPGSSKSVGGREGLTGGMVWLDARVPGICGRRDADVLGLAGLVTRVRKWARMTDRGLSCLGPFLKSEGKTRLFRPWESWMPRAVLMVDRQNGGPETERERENQF